MNRIPKPVLAAGIALVLMGGALASATIPAMVAEASASQAFSAGDAGLFGAMPIDLSGSFDERGPGGPSLTAAATYIGITEAQLRTELGTDKSLADVAIAHGKTRDGLIAAIIAAEQARIKDRVTKLVDRKGRPQGGPGGRGGPGFGFRAEGDPFAAAATYLGISAADLKTKLTGGQTLAQVAAATSGKSRDGLIKALVADATTKIDQAVKDGKLTADQATKLKTDLADHMTTLVDSAPRTGGPGGPRR